MNPKGRTSNLEVDALRQVFLSKEDYECLRVKRKLCERIQRPLAMVSLCLLWGSVLISMAVMFDIVFAYNRPRLSVLPEEGVGGIGCQR